MIKIGETHLGRNIVNIEGIWVKYRYSFGEGECTIDTFERRWVLPQAIETNESPSHKVTEAEAFGNDCPNNSCS